MGRMLKPVRLITIGLCVVFVFLLTAASSLAHGIVGNRLFIEPLVTEDANPKNELDLPLLEAISSPDGRRVNFNYRLKSFCAHASPWTSKTATIGSGQ